MSRNDEKAGNVVDMDFSALDQELAELARETPEVPAGFHDSWMQAIREDAKNNPREAAPAAADKTEGRKADIRRQRRHILSAAAAFVVVIGGVWLLRDRVDVLNRVETTPAPVVQEQAAPVAGPASEQEGSGTVRPAEQDEAMMPAENAYEESEQDPAEIMMNYASAGGFAGEAAYKTSAAKTEETDTAYEADSWDSAGEAEESSGLYMASEAAESSFRPEETETAAAEEAAAEETAAEEPMPAPTAVPATPEPTAVPAAPEAAEPAGTEAQAPAAAAAAAAGETGETEEAENISFLQRVWNFVLKITPWALAVAVAALFLITYVIRAIKRKKQKEK